MNKTCAQDHSASKEQNKDLNLGSLSSEPAFFPWPWREVGEGECVCVCVSLCARTRVCVCMCGSQGIWTSYVYIILYPGLI